MSQWVRHRDLLKAWTVEIGLSGGWGDGWGDGFGSGQSFEEPGPLISQCIAYATAIANYYGDTPDYTGAVSGMNRLRVAYETIAVNLGFEQTRFSGTLNEQIISAIRTFSIDKSNNDGISQNERMLWLMSNELNKLMRDRIAIEDDLTWTRTGTRKDSFGNDTEIAPNTSDAVDLPGNMQAYGVFGGATNGCTTIVEDWVAAATTMSTPGGGVISAVNAVTGNKTLDDISASPSTTWTAVFNIELLSGDPSGFAAGLGESGGGSVDIIDISDMQIGEVREIVATGALSATATQARIEGLRRSSSAGTGTCSVRVTDPRLTETTAPYPAFANGTIAGETYGPDILVFEGIDWSEPITIMLGAVPCGYDGADNPNSSFARFLEINGVISVSRPGNILLQDSVNSIATGVAVDSCVPTVLSVDFDGSTMGIRVDDVARMTAVQTDALAGDLILGNLAAGNRAFQGKMSITIYQKIFTDAEYETVREWITTELEKLI